MKKVILSFVALAAVVACNQDKGLEQSRRFTIKAGANETKTLLDGDAVKWQSGDAIALCFTSTDKTSINTFTTAETGVSVNFTGSLANDVTVAEYGATGHAVYPADAMDNTGKVTATLAENVTAYENGSFVNGKNLASAVVSLSDLKDNGTTTAQFLNAFSIIRFTVPADVATVEITADGNLAGSAAFVFNKDGRLVADSWTNELKTIMVTPENATFTAGKTYNVLVYPGAFTSLKAKLTDSDGCVFEKTNAGSFNFEPAKFYTFNFYTKFVKAYEFAATGKAFAAGDQIAAVYKSESEVLFEETLAASADNKFSVTLPKEVIEGATSGFAVYPNTAYDMTDDKITYTLATTGTYAELYAAKLTVGAAEAAFSKYAPATLKFTVPAGVQTVAIASDKNFVGTAEMTVDATGKLVAGTPDGNTVDLTPAGQATSHALNVFPVTGANLTFTLKDAQGRAVTKTATATVAAGGSLTLDLGNISFEQSGSFSAEGFTAGTTTDFGE